jgi:hypothetical protein
MAHRNDDAQPGVGIGSPSDEICGYRHDPSNLMNRHPRAVPSIPIPAGGSGDLSDQPGATWVGELLCGRELRRVLQLHSRLGGKEGSAPHDEGSETKGLRLDAVE